MITKDSEYTMLKQEIISLAETQNTYIIAMYTITITILGVAFERRSQILFLLPYVILFSFQRIISAKRDGILRIAAYIAVYLEEGNGWESVYEDVVSKTIKKSNCKKVFSSVVNVIIGRLSSLQLGLLCSLGSILMDFFLKGITFTGLCEIRMLDCIVPISAVILFVNLYYLTKDGLKLRRQQYIECLKVNKDAK